MLVRQYFDSTLSGRMKELRPPTLVEKLWLSFQLLAAVTQVHAEGLAHGDIKPDNVMLTSAGQLFLTDFASFKPTFISEDSLSDYTLFFTEQTKKCYLAPERLVPEPRPPAPAAPAMDIFSVGCVIAELFMDGTPLFDLAALQNYRKGRFSPERLLTPRLRHLGPALTELLLRMVALEPASRGQISELFAQFNARLFPPALGGFAFPLGAALRLPQFALADERVLLLRYHFDLVWKSCFASEVPLLQHAGSHVVCEGMPPDPLPALPLVPSNIQRFYGPDGLPRDALIAETRAHPSADWRPEEVSEVVVAWLAASLESALHPSSKLAALEMLAAIATDPACPDYLRFQRVLPFALALFEDEQPKVRAFAVQMSVDIVASYRRDGMLAPTDLKLFENYIWPFYLTLMTQSHASEPALVESELVRLLLLRNLPRLLRAADHFLQMSVISRLHHEAPDVHPRAATPVVAAAPEALLGYDEVKEELRRDVKNILESSFSVFHEGSLQALLQAELIRVLPQVGVFLGHEKLNNVVIPLILTSFNKTNFLRKLACLESVGALGLLVGEATLEQYILPCLEFVLYEANEALVFQTLATYTELASLRLLSRTKELEALDALLPFLLHPCAWLRLQTRRFFAALLQAYSLPDQFCHLRPRLNAFAREPLVLLDRALLPLPLPIPSTSLLDLHILPPLSRYEFANGLLSKHTQPLVGSLIAKLAAYSKATLERNKSAAFRDRYIAELRALRLAPLSLSLDLAPVSPSTSAPEIPLHTAPPDDSDEDDLEEEKAPQGFTSHFVTSAPRASSPRKKHRLSEEALLAEALLDSDSLPIESEDTLPLDLHSNADSEHRTADLKTNLGLNAHGFRPKPRKRPARKKHQRPLEGPAPFDADRLFVQEALGLAPLVDSVVLSALTCTRPEDELPEPPPPLQSLFQAPQPWHPSGAILTTLHEHRGSVTSIAVASDQRHFATGASDGAVKLWSVAALEDDARVMRATTLSLGQRVRKLAFFHNSLSLAVACEKGALHVYSCGAPLSAATPSKDLAFVSRDFLHRSSSQTRTTPDNFSLLRRFRFEGEGDMALCHTFAPRSVAGGMSVFCVTQRGTARLLDLRMRAPAFSLRGGPEHGLPSALATDRYEQVVFVGTLGGYLQLVDLRFHLADQFLHWGARAEAVPIFSLASFQPDHTAMLRLPGAHPSELTGNFCENTPLLLAGRGAPSAHEIALINMNTLQPEVFLRAPMGGAAEVADPPVLVREPPRADFTNAYLLRKYARRHIASAFHELEQLLEHDRRLNVSDEWLANSKLRYGALKSSFRAATAVRALLVPAFASTASGSFISQPCFLSAGSDAKLRFWDLQKDSNRSFLLNAPPDANPRFSLDFFGDMYLIAERESSPTDRTDLLPANGATSASYFTSNNPSHARKAILTDVSHKDAILDLALVAGPRGAPLLVTCGRDSLVKIWS